LQIRPTWSRPGVRGGGFPSLLDSDRTHTKERHDDRDEARRAAERDKRLDAAALTLIITLKERDALERRAGAAIRAMLTDGLTLADIPTWTDGETTLKEATRLSELDARDRARS
jgi:hypothetical protein